MASLNKVQLIGHLGADPDVRHLSSGDAVASLRIATTETWKDKQTGEKKEQTEWHRVSVFGRMADVCAEYLHKGDQVYIEGQIRTREYEQDGVKKYSTEIKAQEVKFLRTKGGDQGETESRPPAKAAPKEQGGGSFDDLDDIPF